MYIYGLPGNPSTYGCCPDNPKIFGKKMVEKASKWMQKPIFAVYIPDVKRVWVVGVKSKHDTFTAWTTEKEARAQHNRYLKYFSPAETYLISFGDEENDR
jgi:hypothetical protein